MNCEGKYKKGYAPTVESIFHTGCIGCGGANQKETEIEDVKGLREELDEIREDVDERLAKKNTTQDEFFKMLATGKIEDALWHYPTCKATPNEAGDFLEKYGTIWADSASFSNAIFQQVETSDRVYLFIRGRNEVFWVKKSDNTSGITYLYEGNNNYQSLMLDESYSVLNRCGDYIFFKREAMNSNNSEGEIGCIHDGRVIWTRRFTSRSWGWWQVSSRFNILSQPDFQKSIELSAISFMYLFGAGGSDSEPAQIYRVHTNGNVESIGSSPVNFADRPNDVCVDFWGNLWLKEGALIYCASPTTSHFSNYRIRASYPDGIFAESAKFSILKCMPNGKTYLVQVIQVNGDEEVVMYGTFDSSLPNDSTVEMKEITRVLYSAHYDFLQKGNDLYFAVEENRSDDKQNFHYLIKINEAGFTCNKYSKRYESFWKSGYSLLRAMADGRVYSTVNVIDATGNGRVQHIYEDGEIVTLPAEIDLSVYPGITERFSHDKCKYLVTISHARRNRCKILELKEDGSLAMTNHAPNPGRYILKQKGCETVGFAHNQLSVGDHSYIWRVNEFFGFKFNGGEPLEYSQKYFTSIFQGLENTYEFKVQDINSNSVESENISWIKNWNIKDAWISHITSKGSIMATGRANVPATPDIPDANLKIGINADMFTGLRGTQNTNEAWYFEVFAQSYEDGSMEIVIKHRDDYAPWGDTVINAGDILANAIAPKGVATVVFSCVGRRGMVINTVLGFNKDWQDNYNVDENGKIVLSAHGTEGSGHSSAQLGVMTIEVETITPSLTPVKLGEIEYGAPAAPGEYPLPPPIVVITYPTLK